MLIKEPCNCSIVMCVVLLQEYYVCGDVLKVLRPYHKLSHFRHSLHRECYVKVRSLVFSGTMLNLPVTVKGGMSCCQELRYIKNKARPQCAHSEKYKHNTIMYSGLTLTLPGPSAGVSGSLDSYCSLKPLCSGMGEVVPARTSPTLLPPSPRTVLSLSCFKVSQCINCRD